MQFNLSQLEFPHNIQYTPSREELKQMAEHYEFKDITALSGTFTISKDDRGDDIYHLVGTLKGVVVLDDGEKQEILEEMDIFLLKDESKEELFDLEQDIEILEDDVLALDELAGQYVFLSTFEFDEEELRQLLSEEEED